MCLPTSPTASPRLAQIAQVKASLRGWGQPAPDAPGDVDSAAQPIPDQSIRPSPEAIIDRHNRQALIKDMRLRIAERLQSAVKLLALPLAERPGVVNAPGLLIRPYDIARRQPGQADEPLPAHSKIIDLCDAHNYQLLILGAPGAGKTFLMHELARDLLGRAEHDEAAPVPVIFSLAAWLPKQPIETWLIIDLARRLGAKPAMIARLWQAGMILPLLDGLDEVATLERRQQCVEAINAYRAAQDRLSSPLVVACREREYQDLPALKVSTALVVQPLAPALIPRYLAGPSFAGLRQALARDPQLAKALCTPLLLGLVATTYHDRVSELPIDADAAALRTQILRDYVVRCMAPRDDAAALRVPAAQLHAFLVWLARSMTAHDNQQEFYIEFLQPTWLSSRLWIWMWRGLSIIGFGLIGELAFGLIGGLEIGLFFGLERGLVDGVKIGLVGLIIGLLFGLLSELEGRLSTITPVETLTWSWKRIRQKWRVVLYGGLSGGLALGLILGLGGGFGGWLVGGLVGGLIGGLIAGIQTGLADVRSIPSQGIQRSWHSAWLGGLVLGLGGGLIFGLISRLALGLVGGVGGGMALGLGSGFLFYGGAAIIQHNLLRLLLPLSSSAPLNLVRWLEESCQRGLLVHVGGGYRFYHELLQRHFAAHDEPDYPQMPILAESEELEKHETRSQAASCIRPPRSNGTENPVNR
jgi:eukaryotic-like serine/threonine-protein kinase